MYIEDVEELLKNDEHCNFLAMVITPYHAVGVEAAVLYLQSIGVEAKGYVLLTAHPSTGMAVKESNFSLINGQVKFLEFEYAFSKRQSFIKELRNKTRLIKSVCKNDKATDEAFYFVWTESINNLLSSIRQCRANNRIKLIKIDDGAGSYIDAFHRRMSYGTWEAGKKNILRKLRNYFVAYIKSSSYFVADFAIENKLRKTNSFINANVFERVSGKLRKNEDFVQFYETAFSNEAKKNDFECFENAIVINSQALFEFGILDKEIENEIYRNLAVLLRDFSIKIVVKPHPREKNLVKYSGYGWFLYQQNNISQEIILAQLTQKPICIISVYSSTLLNANGVFGVPVVSLAKILYKKRIDKSLRMILERYIAQYKDIIMFPDSFEEFKVILKKLVDKDGGNKCLLSRNS